MSSNTNPNPSPAKLVVVPSFEAPDNLEATLARYYAALRERTRDLQSSSDINAALQTYVAQGKKAHEATCLGLLYGILTRERSVAETYLKQLGMLVRDYNLVTLCTADVASKYEKLSETGRRQLLWLVEELLKQRAPGVGRVVDRLLRQVPGGDVQTTSLWLAYNCVSVLSRQMEWLATQPRLVSMVLFHFLRLAGTHSRLARLKDMKQLLSAEASLCATILKNHKKEAIAAGRDVWLLLQQVSGVPELRPVWVELTTELAQAADPMATTAAAMFSHRTHTTMLVSRLTPNMETYLTFMLCRVPQGRQGRYQHWYRSKFFNGKDRDALIVDVIRFTCAFEPPAGSAGCPRWIILGWLLKCVSQPSRLAYTALIYDFLHFGERDIEAVGRLVPGVMLMERSLSKYREITEGIMHSFIKYVEAVQPEPMQAQCRANVERAFNTLLSKKCIDRLTFANGKTTHPDLSARFRKLFPSVPFSGAGSSESAAPSASTSATDADTDEDMEASSPSSSRRKLPRTRRYRNKSSSSDGAGQKSSKSVLEFILEKSSDAPQPDTGSSASSAAAAAAAASSASSPSSASPASSSAPSQPSEIPDELPSRLQERLQELSVATTSGADPAPLITAALAEVKGPKSAPHLAALVAPILRGVLDRNAGALRSAVTDASVDAVFGWATRNDVSNKLALSVVDSLSSLLSDTRVLFLCYAMDVPVLSERGTEYVARRDRQLERARTAIELYTAFITELGSGALAEDLRRCGELDPELLCSLVPLVYQWLRSATASDVDVLHLTVTSLNPPALLELQQLLVTGDFEIFEGAETAAEMLLHSLEWDTVSQEAAWQLMRAQLLVLDPAVYLDWMDTFLTGYLDTFTTSAGTLVDSTVGRFAPALTSLAEMLIAVEHKRVAPIMSRLMAATASVEPSNSSSSSPAPNAGSSSSPSPSSALSPGARLLTNWITGIIMGWLARDGVRACRTFATVASTYERSRRVTSSATRQRGQSSEQKRAAAMNLFRLLALLRSKTSLYDNVYGSSEYHQTLVQVVCNNTLLMQALRKLRAAKRPDRVELDFWPTLDWFLDRRGMRKSNGSRKRRRQASSEGESTEDEEDEEEQEEETKKATKKKSKAAARRKPTKAASKSASKKSKPAGRARKRRKAAVKADQKMNRSQRRVQNSESESGSDSESESDSEGEDSDDAKKTKAKAKAKAKAKPRGKRRASATKRQRATAAKKLRRARASSSEEDSQSSSDSDTHMAGSSSDEDEEEDAPANAPVVLLLDSGGTDDINISQASLSGFASLTQAPKTPEKKT